MSIPFESLDIERGVRIDLSLEHLFVKVIEDKRGGYCYELNYLFHALLLALGFDSRMVSASIFHEDTLGPPFDHMSIIVQLDDLWLVDVGYGDLFVQPLKIVPGIIQNDQFKIFKIERIDDNKYLLFESLLSKENFIKRYVFELTPRIIQDFEDQNQFKQRAPESYFLQNVICTLPTKHGRKTILNDHFKIRSNLGSSNVLIKNEKHFKLILQEEFNITLV